MNDTLTAPKERIFSRETERNLDALDAQIRTLTGLCERLSAERAALHSERDRLAAEHETLRAEHRRTRDRIDAMVARLKGLDEN